MSNQDPIAENKTARLVKRQGIERIALEEGEKRARYEDELAATTQCIIELMPDALEAGIPLDTYAKLVGVSRQTLYRWRDAVSRLNEA
jgi:hypothetical protein